MTERTENLRNLIVVGASAGGIRAMSRLLSQIPEKKNLAVLMVLHLSVDSQGEPLIEIFRKNTSMVCGIPVDNQIIETDHVYLAPVDFHMTVSDGLIRVLRGPREHRFRPSIDVLFRSAAVNFGSQVIGIILSGMLDDGTSGMSAIKKCGGICIVQDPSEAEYNQMPLHVINAIDVDYKIGINEMRYVLEDLLSRELPPGIPVPPEIKKEVLMTNRVLTSINNVEEIGERTEFICPDCGGGLWRLKDNQIQQYRCHIGHAFSEENLLIFKQQDLEESLWVSIRMMEERLNLLNQMVKNSGKNSGTYRNRAQETEKHIAALKVIQSNLVKSDQALDQ